MPPGWKFGINCPRRSEGEGVGHGGELSLASNFLPALAAKKQKIMAGRSVPKNGSTLRSSTAIFLLCPIRLRPQRMAQTGVYGKEILGTQASSIPQAHARTVTVRIYKDDAGRF